MKDDITKYHDQINIIDLYYAMCNILENLHKQLPTKINYKHQILYNILEKILKSDNSPIKFIKIHKELEKNKLSFYYKIIREITSSLYRSDDKLKEKLVSIIKKYKPKVDKDTLNEALQLKKRGLYYVKTKEKNGILSIESSIHQEKFKPLKKNISDIIDGKDIEEVKNSIDLELITVLEFNTHIFEMITVFAKAVKVLKNENEVKYLEFFKKKLKLFIVGFSIDKKRKNSEQKEIKEISFSTIEDDDLAEFSEKLLLFTKKIKRDKAVKYKDEIKHFPVIFKDVMEFYYSNIDTDKIREYLFSSQNIINRHIKKIYLLICETTISIRYGENPRLLKNNLWNLILGEYIEPIDIYSDLLSCNWDKKERRDERINIESNYKDFSSIGEIDLAEIIERATATSQFARSNGVTGLENYLNKSEIIDIAKLAASFVVESCDVSDEYIKRYFERSLDKTVSVINSYFSLFIDFIDFILKDNISTNKFEKLTKFHIKGKKEFQITKKNKLSLENIEFDYKYDKEMEVEYKKVAKMHKIQLKHYILSDESLLDGYFDEEYSLFLIYKRDDFDTLVFLDDDLFKILQEIDNETIAKVLYYEREKWLFREFITILSFNRVEDILELFDEMKAPSKNDIENAKRIIFNKAKKLEKDGYIDGVGKVVFQNPLKKIKASDFFEKISTNLQKKSDMEIQTILKNDLDLKELLYLLFILTEETKKRIYDNLSSRAKNLIIEEFEYFKKKHSLLNIKYVLKIIGNVFE